MIPFNKLQQAVETNQAQKKAEHELMVHDLKEKYTLEGTQQLNSNLSYAMESIAQSGSVPDVVTATYEIDNYVLNQDDINQVANQISQQVSLYLGSYGYHNHKITLEKGKVVKVEVVLIEPPALNPADTESLLAFLII